MTAPAGGAAAPQREVSVGEIFLAFLVVGATSFGGGVLAYLRASLVGKHRWVDDATFVEFMAISQTLPGLNGTNMAVLVGSHLRGGLGACAAVVGLCLPGALFMFAAGVLYRQHRDRPAVTAMLHGVAAAAAGLVFSLTVQLGRKSIERLGDLVFVALAVVGINILHLSLPIVLLAVGALAIWWHRPQVKGSAP